MKTKAIVATLLVAAAASADARFAWPYPRRAVSPDESGHWIVINGNSWPHSAGSEPDRRRTVAKEASKGQLKTGMSPSGLRRLAPSMALLSDWQPQAFSLGNQANDEKIY